MDRLRERIGRRLERGSAKTLVGRALAGAWSALAAPRVARPVEWPEGARVVGVGGAVLGGAGKTPVAIAIAEALSRADHPVALIGHAYRASPGRARLVSPDDPVSLVGDDALAAARALADARAPVFVAGDRASAMALAVQSGKTLLVVDGLLQASPARVDDAVLVLDGEAPFGAGSCPPLGDLRAPPEALLSAADHVIALGPASGSVLPEGALPIAGAIDGALDASAQRVDLASIAGARVGLLCAIARPDRLVRALAREGIRPATVLALGDHARFGPAALERARRAEVEVWLTTTRCATKLPARIGRAVVLALRHRVDVGPLVERLWVTNGRRAQGSSRGD